jgi:hypothetical protein
MAPNIKPYKKPAAGWGSVRAVTEILWREGNQVSVVGGARSDLYRTLGSCSYAMEAQKGADNSALSLSGLRSTKL